MTVQDTATDHKSRMQPTKIETALNCKDSPPAYLYFHLMNIVKEESDTFIFLVFNKICIQLECYRLLDFQHCLLLDSLT